MWDNIYTVKSLYINPRETNGTKSYEVDVGLWRFGDMSLRAKAKDDWGGVQYRTHGEIWIERWIERDPDF